MDMNHGELIFSSLQDQSFWPVAKPRDPGCALSKSPFALILQFSLLVVAMVFCGFFCSFICLFCFAFLLEEERHMLVDF